MKNDSIYLKPITLKNIMKFVLPTIAMSLFMSFYTMVDGLFVSNLIGTNALSAVVIFLHDHFARNSNFNDVGYGWKCCDHEKNGRKERGRGKI